MLGGIIVLFATTLLGIVFIQTLKRRHPFLNTGLLTGLLFFHILLSFAYYGYILVNGSDSLAYYQKVYYLFRGDHWWDFYGTSTRFIEFLGFPLINFFGFSYQAVMALFSFLGFLGFLYFYIFFRENIKYQHRFLSFDLITFIFFLPNLHFWSTSFGKGSVIFLGLGLFFYGISKMKSRIFAIILGGIIVYHVRPHILLVILIASLIGFVFSSKGVSTIWRITFLVGASIAFFLIFRDVLTLIGVDEEQMISQGLDLTHRATELSKASSGIDIANYSLPEQVFAFLYRPLFFDAPGALGWIVSFENAFYLYMTFLIFSRGAGWKFLFRGTTLTKTAFLSFFIVSIVLAQIAGNLGLAMRQKSQVMILFLFVVVAFLDQQRHEQVLKAKLRSKKRRQLNNALERAFENGTGGIDPA